MNATKITRATALEDAIKHCKASRFNVWCYFQEHPEGKTAKEVSDTFGTEKTTTGKSRVSELSNLSNPYIKPKLDSHGQEEIREGCVVFVPVDIDRQFNESDFDEFKDKDSIKNKRSAKKLAIKIVGHFENEEVEELKEIFDRIMSYANAVKAKQLNKKTSEYLLSRLAEGPQENSNNDEE